jgi:hypothetical protein
VVVEGVRRMSAQIVTGLFTLLGVALGLFGERWVRTVGRVRCDLRWANSLGAGGVDSPGGVEVQQRQLEVTFLNRKDVPVTVWDMQVTFYKGDMPLDEEERPQMNFAPERSAPARFERATLPPRIHVSRTVVVSPGHNEYRRQQAVEEADRIEFTAEIEGAGTISARLAPWDTLEDQEERVETPRFSIHPTS